MMKTRLLCILLCLLLLNIAAPSFAELVIVDDEEVLAEDGAWPDLNAAGFLDSGEFVYEDAENGIWRYCSSTLKVEILRHSATEPRKLIWYEA